jgi:hypothetical protein
VIIGLEVLTAWQHEAGEFKLSRYLDPVIRVTLTIGAWTTAWAVLSRIFSGQAHVERVLLYALSGLLAYSFYNEISGDVAFALSWPQPQQFQYAALWTALGAVSFCHLREIGRTHLWLKGGLVAVAMTLAIGAQTLSQSESSSSTDSNVAATNLLPPAFRLRPLQSEDRFFAEVEKLKSKLDKARSDDQL